MRGRSVLLGALLLVSCVGCATGPDQASTTPAPAIPGAGGMQVGRRCNASGGITCTLRTPGALDAPCTCDSPYGPQSGKVAP